MELDNIRLRLKEFQLRVMNIERKVNLSYLNMISSDINSNKMTLPTFLEKSLRNLLTQSFRPKAGGDKVRFKVRNSREIDLVPESV